MANGLATFLKRITEPSAPAVGKASLYIDDSGAVPKPKLKDDDGTVYGFESIYGSEFNIASKHTSTPETNNQTTPVTYLSLNYLSVTKPAGSQYTIEVNYIWNYSATNNDFVARVLLDGVPLQEDHRQEPKDTSQQQRYIGARKFLISDTQILTSGTIEFEYATDSNGANARIFECTIELKRVK